MKYEYYPKRRTEQERRDLNEQILRLLQSGACEQAGVTDEDIFNRYSQDESSVRTQIVCFEYTPL